MSDPEDPEQQKPDWNSFETWKGEEPSRVPGWLQTIFHWGMLALLAAIVFAISGALITFASYRIAAVSAHALTETRGEFAAKFVGGGILGLGTLIYSYFKKLDRSGF